MSGNTDLTEMSTEDLIAYGEAYPHEARFVTSELIRRRQHDKVHADLARPESETFADDEIATASEASYETDEGFLFSASALDYLPYYPPNHVRYQQPYNVPYATPYSYPPQDNVYRSELRTELLNEVEIMEDTVYAAAEFVSGLPGREWIKLPPAVQDWAIETYRAEQASRLNDDGVESSV